MQKTELSVYVWRVIKSVFKILVFGVHHVNTEKTADSVFIWHVAEDKTNRLILHGNREISE